MKSKTVRVLTFLCALVLLSGIGAPAFAAQGDRQVVNVGFFEFKGYHELDADGRRSGYGYEYLQEMLDYTDWRYNYVGYDSSWSDMLQMLQDGEIDLVTSATKTAAREALFDYSDLPIGISSAILTVRAGNTRFSAADYAGWNGMHVGMLTGNSRNDSFAAFAAAHGFSYEQVLYATPEALTGALADGVLDAAVTSNLRRTDGEWILAEFDAKPFYIIVKKGNAELLAQVNAALSQLNAASPGLTNELFAKYYASDTGGKVAYTAEERSFIERCGQDGTVFRAIIDPGRAPYSYNGGDGAVTGILADLCAEIFDRTGLRVEFLKPADRAEYLSLLAGGTVDLCCDCADDDTAAEDAGWILTSPYYSITVSQVTLKSFSGAAENIAIIGGGLVDEATVSLQPGWTVQRFATVAQCLGALHSGDADAVLLLTETARQTVADDERNRLIYTVLPGVSSDVCIGVSVRQNAMLSSIVQKALLSVDEAQAASIAMPYTFSEARGQTFVGILYDNPGLIVGAALVLFVILGLVLIAVSMRKEQRVQARANAALSEAVGQARHANEAKSRFLSQMSHEIRTPLNAIVGLTALARGNSGDPARVDDYLHKIEGASQMLLGLINEVLDMAAIENGKMKIDHAKFDVRTVLDSLSSIYYEQCRQKNVRFQLSVDLQDESFLGDSRRISQILANLLSNAVKFTGPGGSVSMSVCENRREGATAWLKFVVCDTGTGMTRSMIERLFLPFEQESTQSARKYGGSGLGLSITKNLVSLMNGSIEVQSEKDVGTTFTVQLPLECCGDSRAPARRKIRNLRALVVDDDREALAYAALLLQRMGVCCDTADSGEAAVEAVRRHKQAGEPYGACIIDWKMPAMSGIELTRGIRAIAGSDPLIIIASAYDVGDIGDEAKAAGADALAAKPLFQSTLFDLLAPIAGKSAGGAADGRYDFSGRRLLVAEDNDLNREVDRGIFDMVKMQADYAVDGEQAVAMFVSSPPGTYDAILMDIQMPGMDGYEATRRIRASAHPEAKTIPIFAMTANAFLEDVSASLACGMDGHIAKPIDTGKLFETLRAAVSKREDAR
ncbi:MAG: response regulator [Oscillospiraceae bacterium]|nr:response regulator [Oscillospiraceae bacterium]